MKKVKKDVDRLMSIEQKKKLLKELGQEDLLEVFKNNYTNSYSPPISKKSPLDQQISFSINSEEKDMLTRELMEIRRIGPGISISAYVRNQATKDIDIKDWSERSLRELRRLNSDEYDIEKLQKQAKIYRQVIEESEDEEEIYSYRTDLAHIERKIEHLKKNNLHRRYRLSGRVTFQEAQIIRWRAGRLNISIADYMRYAVFGYLPGQETDRGLSLNERKRLYISILDVDRNGWGTPPKLDECPNCIRYIREIKALKEKIENYKNFISQNEEQ